MSRRPTSAAGLVVLPHRRFGRIDLAGAGTGTGTMGRSPRSGPAASVAAATVLVSLLAVLTLSATAVAVRARQSGVTAATLPPLTTAVGSAAGGWAPSRPPW